MFFCFLFEPVYDMMVKQGKRERGEAMERIRLSREGAEAVVCTRGGEMVSCRTAEGRELLWQADPRVWDQSAPILFPVCGVVKDGVIRIGGKPFPMPMHGFAQGADFQLLRKGEGFVELGLFPTEKIRACYPFNFAFHVTHTLNRNGYRTDFLVQNHSDQPMPFCVGGHPGIICPMEAGAAFEDYDLVFPEREDGWNTRVLPGGFAGGGEVLQCLKEQGRIPLDHTWFDEKDTLLLTHLRSRSVQLRHRVSGHGIQMDFPNMEVLAVWSKPGAGANYVCLEPWHGLPDPPETDGCFEQKAFVTVLAKEEAWQASFEIRTI